MSGHECHAEGCTRSVPPRMLMCGRHWRMVPKRLQKAVWATYRRGQERDKRPSWAYLMVQARTRIEVARLEGADASTAWADLGIVLRKVPAFQDLIEQGVTRGEILAAVDAIIQDPKGAW